MRSAARVMTVALVLACGREGSPLPVDDAPVLSIREAVVAEPATGTMTAGYATLSNATEEADTLVALESPGAGAVEIHEQVVDGDRMRMEPREWLVVPAGADVVLAPGGLHLMLTGLSDTLEAGDSVEIRFRFARAGLLTRMVPVVPYADLP